MLRVHTWFHGPDCKKVERNKQTKRKDKRKIFILPHGKLFALGCEHHSIRYCSKKNLQSHTWNINAAKIARFVTAPSSMKVLLVLMLLPTHFHGANLRRVANLFIQVSKTQLMA